MASRSSLVVCLLLALAATLCHGRQLLQVGRRVWSR